VPDKGALTGRSVDMNDFAEMLAIWAGRKVIDKTGIEGLFDIRLPQIVSVYAVNAAPVDGGRGGAPAPGTENRSNFIPLPTVFDAVQQFGLKLESTKGPVEVLVIDNVERPAEN
jgi:uncharacterized protein (TIGR03435 family)